MFTFEEFALNDGNS